ncbi:unnamed protein product [Ophioblennius macclurei]
MSEQRRSESPGHGPRLEPGPEPEPGPGFDAITHFFAKHGHPNSRRPSPVESRSDYGSASSIMSMRSDNSMGKPIDFKSGQRSADQRLEHGGEQRLKPGLRKYFSQLQLDTNSMSRRLKLSNNNMKVTRVEEVQSYPDHPDRFDYWTPQLLSRNDLSGRCYWEVEWSGDVYISVSYRGIRRRGDWKECVFGWNDQSWSLSCSDGGYYVRHNNKQTPISSSSSSSGRVAVYVDCPAGSLSFFRVSSDSLIHLYTFNTTFTQPLCAGFALWSSGSSVSLCPL